MISYGSERERLLSLVEDTFTDVVAEVENLLKYESEDYPRERVFEEIRELLSKLG